MYALYTAGLILVGLAALPGLLLAMARGKYRRDLPERFGRYPAAVRREGGQPGPGWLHAVSVGEVMAATPLVAELQRRRPAVPLIVSTVTETGRQVARARFPGARGIVFFPVDLPGPVARALDHIRPRAVLLTETEVWPNFLAACAERGVPVILINGRISSRSFRRYRRVKRWTGRVLSGVRLFCMQTERDAERIRTLGAPPERVRVTGNLKFDLPIPETAGGDAGEFLKRTLAGDQPPLWVAGSTHPGEEALVLDAFGRVRRRFPETRLVLVPRHPERAGEIEALLRGRGYTWVRRSVGGNGRAPVILWDTMGELPALYAVARLVFVGGSLVPVGGHNILEPAACSRPIVFGPHMDNFAEIAELFLVEGGARRVADADELAGEVIRLLADAGAAGVLGARARAILEAGQGAAVRTADLVEAYL